MDRGEKIYYKAYTEDIFRSGIPVKAIFIKFGIHPHG